jgi:hypothetical protein
VAEILLNTAPAGVFRFFLPAPQNVEDDVMRHVAKNDDAAEEEDGEEPGVTDLDSVNRARRHCGKCQTENVVRRHSFALPDSILCVRGARPLGVPALAAFLVRKEVDQIVERGIRAVLVSPDHILSRERDELNRTFQFRVVAVWIEFQG